MTLMRYDPMALFLFRNLAGRRAALGLLLGLAVAGGPAAGQAVPPPAPDSLDGIARKLARYQQQGPHEKLFLHLDRPVYLSGETMWFKVYAVDGTSAQPLALSSVAYVEVLDAARRPVLQGKVALRHATGQGSFLLPAGLAAGSYTVRAYTSWMKNAAPDAYFHAAVTVVNTFAASGAGSQDSATYDAQFFPEGGNLVRGLQSRIGVKVTDKAGRGLAAQGKVLNQAGAVVATFATPRLGMGSFAFTPATATAGSYTAVLTLANRQVLSRKLPQAYEQGHVLRLENTGPTELTLTVNATGPGAGTVFLLGHSRQKIAVAQRAQLVGGRAVFVVDKSQLLDGVSHFTLFGADHKPLCERLYFQPPTRQLAIVAGADKPHYAPRERVSVQVATADQQAPLPANLSMAVYRLDSLTTAPVTAIDRYLALTSDVPGRVENPDYYFTAPGPEAAEAADHLMLTQGWSRFRWEDVLADPAVPFGHLPEPYGPVVEARLTRAGTQLPRPGVTTFLSSPGRTPRLSNARSDAQGLVRFEMNGFSGVRELVLQTDPAQDSTSRLAVLDPFSPRYAAAPLPPFGLTPGFRRDYAARHLQAQVQAAYAGQFRNRFAPEPVDSLAFYGRPSEEYLLDKYTRFKVMEEVLREYVPGVMVRIRKDGFHLLVIDKLSKTVLQENPLVLLDGVPVFNINRIMAMNPLKIRKLEVIDGRYFHGLAVYNGVVSFATYTGNLEGFAPDAQALVQQYEGVQRQREFYAPRYDTPQAAQSRLPDLRNLLYWNPEISTSGTAPRTLDFYTGDQAGRYLVVLQGLAANGLAGSTRFVVEVKPAL